MEITAKQTKQTECLGALLAVAARITDLALLDRLLDFVAGCGSTLAHAPGLHELHAEAVKAAETGAALDPSNKAESEVPGRRRVEGGALV